MQAEPHERVNTAWMFLLWMVLPAVFVLWCIVSLSLVPDIDHGVFLWVGHVLRSGGLPYVDTAETKGPVAYLLWAFASSFGPLTDRSLRAFDAALWLGAMMMARQVTRHVFGHVSSGAPVAAGLFAGAVHVSAGFGHVAQPDEWGGWFVLGAVLLALHASRWSLAFLVGMLVALSAGIKPSFAVFGAVPLVILVWPDGGAYVSDRIRLCVATVGGSVATVALIVLWFASVGALDELIDIHLRFNLQAYAGSDAPAAPSAAPRLLGEMPWAWLVLAPMAVLGTLRMWTAPDAPRARSLVVALWLWVGLALLNTRLQGKYWVYHYSPGSPALALLASGALLQKRGMRRWGWGAPCLVAVIGLLVMGRSTSVVGAWYKRVFAGQPLDDWHAWGGARTQLHRGLPSVGAYIKSQTTPDDPVLIFSQDAALYSFADRWPPTRFGINLALILGADRPQRRRFREEFMADLRARPLQRVVLWDDRNALLKQSSREYLLAFPEFSTLLRDQYVRDTVIGPFEVLKPR
jgi:hypothetical protein